MRTYTQNGATVIAPQGYLSADDETDALEEALTQAFDQGAKLIIIDCSAVSQVNSTAFGVLISAYFRATRTGGRFALANVNKDVESNLAITKLTLVFDIYPTVELAVAALTQPPPEI